MNPSQILIKLSRKMYCNAIKSSLLFWVAGVLLTTPTTAFSLSVSAPLWESVNDIVNAAIMAEDNDKANTLLAVLAAHGHLGDAYAALAGQTALDQVKFGKKLVSEEKKLQKLYDSLSASNWDSTAAVKNLSKSSKSLQKLATLAGRPLLTEVNAKTAGFHKAGESVTMSFAVPPACGTNYTLSCPSNDGVIAGVVPSGTSGQFLVTMGLQRGGSYCEVTGCAPPVSARWLLYNYGAPPVPGVPAGAPSSLPNGIYNLVYSYTISPGGPFATNVPLGSFPLNGNMKDFYDDFNAVMTSIVNSVAASGCTQRVSWTAFNGSSFSTTVTITCQSGCPGQNCVTSTGVLTFTFTKS